MAAMSRIAEEEGAFNPRRFSRLSHRSRTRFSHEDVRRASVLPPPASPSSSLTRLCSHVPCLAFLLLPSSHQPQVVNIFSLRPPWR